MSVELTPEIRERRKAVAHDVIAQVEAANLSLSRCVYLAICHGAGIAAVSAARNRGVVELKEVVDEVASSCDVCLRGALILSKARLLDAVPLSALAAYSCGFWLGREDTEALLADTFDRDTLDLLETAFQQCDTRSCRAEQGHLDAAVKAALRFGGRYATKARSVVAAMRNLIANDGELKP